MQTFLLTDIEGSTRLWEQHAGRMSAALARHDHLLRQSVAMHGGTPVKHTGDGLLAVFHGGDPLACAVQIQVELSRTDFRDVGGLKVRIGIHSGEATARGGDYFGPAINRLARILGAGWGGQILLTRDAAARCSVPPGAQLRGLGFHALRDLPEPQEILSLVHPDLPVKEFPRLRTLSAQTADFVGREREFSALTAALDDAIAGRGRLVMLVGEPGIGKTRAAEELANIARDRGVEVLWGRCREERGAPPFWPWIRAIAGHVEAADVDALRSELGPDATVVGEFVAAVREKVSGLESITVLNDPEAARFRLFNSLASFLKRAARSKPLLIILDDLHWADTASLKFLEFLVPDLPSAGLIVVGTYRDVDVSRHSPLASTLGELIRQRPYTRLVLRGLDLKSTTSIMRSAGVANIPPRFVSEIHSQTEGNPLFVNETVQLLAQEGMLAPERMADLARWRFRLPEGVREVIGRRLDRLSERCNEVLVVASVMGRQFSLPQLFAVLNDPTSPAEDHVSEDRLLEILEESLAVRVIEELQDAVGHYQFTHALIQETLTNELSITKRVRVHARIGKAMEVMYGADAGKHAAELAYHFAQAESATGPEKVVRYSMLAGEQALDTYAYEVAVRHFKLALAAKGEGPPDVEKAEALAGLAHAQAGSLERTEMQAAIDSLAQAVDCFLVIGERQRAVAVSAIPLKAIPGSTDVGSLLERVLPYLDDQSTVTPLLLARYGEALGIERNDPERASAFLARAESVAKSLNDSEAIMNVSARRLLVEMHHGIYEGMSEKAEKVRRQARELGNTDVEEVATTTALVAQVIFGDAEGMKETMRVAWELTQNLRRAQDIEQMCQILASCHALFGDWSQARSLLERGERIAPEAPRLLGCQIFVEYATGNAEEGGRRAERLLARMRAAPANANWVYIMTGHVLPAVVRMGADGGLLGPAKAANEAVLSDRLAPRQRRSYAWRGLGMIAAELADSGLAMRVYQPLLEAGFPWQVTNRRVLGLVARTMGREDLARTHFEDNLVFCRRAGFKPELAWTCHDYAEMLLLTDAAVDKDGPTRAKSLLDEGEPLADQLSMKPLLAKLTTLRAKLASLRRAAGLPRRPH